MPPFPVIGLSPLTSPGASSDQLDQLIDDLRDASLRAGFFVIKNHGIDWAVVEGAFDSLREFFELPMEKKIKVHQSLPRHSWVMRNRNCVDVCIDLKESMTTGYEPELDRDGAGHQPEILFRKTIWPDDTDAPLFKPAMRAYRSACLGLMRKLSQVMEKMIGVEEGFYKDKATYPVAGIRALYYPPQEPDDNETTGLGAYTDVQCAKMGELTSSVTVKAQYTPYAIRLARLDTVYRSFLAFRTTSSLRLFQNSGLRKRR